MTPAPNAAVAPFEFASDFSASAHQAKTAAEQARAQADRLSECETAAYARGYSDGVASEAAGNAARLASVMEAIGARLETLDADIRDKAARAQGAAAELAFAFARKLAGSLVAANPVTPIADGFASLLTDLAGASDVSVAVHPTLADEARTRIEALAKGRLTGCALHITADETLPPGDCRIDWASGGLIRDQAMLDARLKDLVERTLPQKETP